MDDVLARKPAQLIASGSRLLIQWDEASSYVSRGAQKLQAALDVWPVPVSGSVAVDVGASTGGFTDLLLRRGARRVYAIDVGYGQLHYRLRQDPRVVVMERTNVRYLSELPESMDLATADVSFISLRLALPAVFGLLAPTAPLVALVKPQFEAGREQVGRGGVVRDPAVHERVLVELARWSESCPWQLTAALPSPIRGPAGNIEFLSLWQRDAHPLLPAAAARVVQAAAVNRDAT